MLVKLSRAVVVGVAVAAVGCVQFNHRGYDIALRSGADHPIGPLQRSQVHLFLLSGLDPTGDAQLFRLRDELNRAGYAMVHTAQREDDVYVRKEMHRLRRDQPMARFVLGGFGATADRVRALACTACGEGLPLDAVVLLDPTGTATELVADGPLLTVVRSHRWPAGKSLPTSDVTEVGGVGHLSLASHPLTVATLLRLLDASALRVVLEPSGSLPHLPMAEHPEPTPRPVVPALVAPGLVEN